MTNGCSWIDLGFVPATETELKLWVPMCAGAHAGLLNTILFNRAFGHVKPRDVDSELFDITYVSDPTCKDFLQDTHV